MYRLLSSTMHLQVLIQLVFVMAAARAMPVDRDEPTTTELGITTLSGVELDAAATTDSWPETTTELSPEDDRSLESPSQTIEIRLHPQLLDADQLKVLPAPTTEATASEEATTATSAPASGEDDVKPDRQQADGDHLQPQHGLFGSLSGRFRLKDSIGAALRRAITGTPVVHKLQHLPARTRLGASVSRPAAAAAATGPAKDGGITPRKINFGTGAASSNLPSATRFAFNRHHEPGKHRSPSGGGGGETPAGTRAESDHDWLYVAHHRDGKRPIDTFRIPSTERWFVFGARTERTTTPATTTTTTTTETNEEATSTTASTTSTSTTTTATVPQHTEEPAVSSTNESETTTLTPTPALSGITPEMNYATPETVHATPESVHASAEMDYGTPEVNHATPETNYATPEVNHGTPELAQYGRPEADFVNPDNRHGHLPDRQAARAHDADADKSTGTTVSVVAESTAQVHESEASTQPSAAAESNPSPATKAIGPVIAITLADDAVDSIKELTNAPLDGKAPVSQGLEPSPVDDDEDYGDERGALVANLDSSNNETDPDAHKYLVEEKTPDGYIVGEFGVISRSSGSLRGVRYTAHGSINPQLIQDALRTFLSLK